MLKNQVLFGLIEKNVLLKGNKDYRGGGRCKIRDGCKKWVDLGGDSWGGGEVIALYSLEDRIFVEEKSLPRRHEMSTETNKKPYELPCWWWCRRKNRSDEKKWRKKRSGSLMARQRPCLYTKSSQGSIERRFRNFLSAIDSFLRFDIREKYLCIVVTDIQGSRYNNSTANNLK